MFSRILIANRSEIARRIITTCSQMGIATVVVFSQHDVDAPFVHDADEAVALPIGSSYLDIASIIQAAKRTGAEAIHPGYGFLAENAEFASAAQDAGITFIGPTPETIESMGSKLQAQAVVDRAGVPILPNAELVGGTDAAEAAGEIGYPVLVKASRGGGGKGMRIVTEPGHLDAAIKSATREAESAFGDGTVYLEHYVENPRHVEVQIVGDGDGNVIHLYERECSIQRRFQKIIEETPSPDLDPKLRERLWETAVAAGRAVRYRGAGTVEFIVDSSGGFAFLEMNTRLQVEHPVTELTTGIDLVRMQIDIAAGLPLLSQEEVPRQFGHAIEARLTAETPQDGYLPSTGKVHRFSVPEGVRVDSGIADGVTITHHYDSMVAKVIAHAPTRTEAAARLASALTRTHIHGVDTNRDLLVRVLNDVEFLSGAVGTHFLERKGEVLTAPLAGDETVRSLAAVAALALQAENRAQARVLGSIPSGWRNVPFQPQELELTYGSRPVKVDYSLRRGKARVAVDGSDVAIDAVHAATPSSLDVTIDGVRRVYSVNIVGEDVYVDGPLGSAKFELTPRFSDTVDATQPGSMVAKTPGTVVAVPVTLGDAVTVGQSVMVVEAMKMEQAITAPHAGKVVAIHFDVGDQVESGAVLVEVEGEDG
ncbi:MAG: biotin carboxylase N-terminal domain-containing protein [Acidimicrobiia bacterium]|nr:MAG: biotin carboxylase N-terminal domain-containing protein [Acidimicrobiia bacterium]